MGAEYHHPVYIEPTEARHDTSALDAMCERVCVVTQNGK